MKTKFAPMAAVMAAMLAATGATSTTATSAPLRREVPLRDFHGRDFRTFSRIERNAWIGGHWSRSWHDGRFGWWWTVGPYWYFYNQPIYPYPVYIPPVVEVQPPLLPPATRPAPWYYCDNPLGYYPYVPACNGPWREVPAAPAAGVPPQAG